jgi:hypothetical protein
MGWILKYLFNKFKHKILNFEKTFCMCIIGFHMNDLNSICYSLLTVRSQRALRYSKPTVHIIAQMAAN